MSKHGDLSKGSGRRKEDASKVRDNWDLIFGAKAPMSSPSAAGKPKKDTAMNDEHEHDDEGIDHSEEEWTCDVCGGPMYSAAHWSYGKCDDCGATQELINDDYL